ncbi:unknown [Bacteroides sp. CAG:462]|nr:unknown [Bacteroides sp. CAG:462]
MSPPTSSDTGRQPRRSIPRLRKQTDTCFERLHRHDTTVQTDDSANGIRAIEQRSRSLDDFHTVDCKLVNLQSVVVAPLLSLMPESVFHHQHAVESHAPNEGFRLSGTDVHGTHTRHSVQRLHQAARTLLVHPVQPHTDDVERREQTAACFLPSADHDNLIQRHAPCSMRWNGVGRLRPGMRHKKE